MSAIAFCVRAVARPSARRELLLALLDWTRSARQEGGALAANVYEDAEQPAAFRVEAEWADRRRFEGHLRSDAFGVLLGATELLAQPVQLTVSEPVDVYGADPLPAIRKLRDGRRPALDGASIADARDGA